MPRGRIDRRHYARQVRKFTHVGIDHQIGFVNTTKLLDAGVNMHQFLGWAWHIEKRVRARSHFTQTRANGNDEIGITHPLGECRVESDANITAIIRMPIVQQILPAERAGSRQVVRFDESAYVVTGLARPATATK